MPEINHASLDDALSTDYKGRVVQYVRIGETIYDAHDVRTRFSIDQPLGRATIYMSGPRPVEIEAEGLGAECEIVGGYFGIQQRLFHGRIPADESSYGTEGKELIIDAVGWASMLNLMHDQEIRIPGPVSLKEVFRSLCQLLQVPMSFSEETTYPDGSPIILGGQDAIDSGDIVINDTESPLNWMSRVASLFGYRVFDCPDGVFKQRRVSGIPPSTLSKLVYTQGENIYNIGRRRDSDALVNYWDVKSPRYTDTDGGSREIRSIPLTVPFAHELRPMGRRKQVLSDQVLVTQELVDRCRQSKEIDYSTPEEMISLEVALNTNLEPGDSVTVFSPDNNVELGTFWVTDLSQNIGRDVGTDLYLWRGGGVALPTGQDCIVNVLYTPALHIGNQHITYYKDPTSQDEKVFSLIAPDFFSSIRIKGKVHGSNSYGSGLKDNEMTTGSGIEVWQLDDPTLPESGSNEKKKRGSADLPQLPEETQKRRPYATQDKWWAPFSLPLPGSLKSGPYDVKFVHGKNEDGADDYEVKEVTIEMCGVGVPIFLEDTYDDSSES